jgi:hypothetical protein
MRGVGVLVGSSSTRSWPRGRSLGIWPGDGWSDPGGRIWLLGFVVAALGLLWSEPRVAMVATFSSSNNRWPVYFLFAAVPVGCPATLTGHGGLGRVCWTPVACGLGGGWGVAASARGRGAVRWLSAPFPSAPLLLAGLGGEGK